MDVVDLGVKEYNEALEIQYDYLEKRQKDQIDDALLLVEHPPVITLGKNADQENIVASKVFLEQENIQWVNSNRGGDVTYHGPGQMVGYTIFDLRSNNIGIRKYVWTLEQIFIDLLKEEYGIEAIRNPDHTGVWVGSEKIVAIGLAVKRGVTMHGFAFNVNTNLDHFNFIVPCGIQNKGVTSIQKLLNQPIDFASVKKNVEKYFKSYFVE
jgi:lipoyl(octanoyl) transferase